MTPANQLPEPDTDDNTARAHHWLRLVQEHGRMTLQAAANLGEVLIEQRDLCRQERKRGGSTFSAWVEDNLPIDRSQASRFIQIAENWELLSAHNSSDGPTSIREAVKRIAKIKAQRNAPPKAAKKSADAGADPESTESGSADETTTTNEHEVTATPVPEAASRPEDRLLEYQNSFTAFLRLNKDIEAAFDRFQAENDYTRNWLAGITRQLFVKKCRAAFHHVRLKQPASLCLYCAGEGCRNCRRTGVMPGNTIKEARFNLERSNFLMSRTTQPNQPSCIEKILLAIER